MSTNENVDVFQRTLCSDGETGFAYGRYVSLRQVQSELCQKAKAPLIRKMIIKRETYENEIAYLKAVCRIAADRLRDGGTFPIKGETWELLDFAAGQQAGQSSTGRSNRTVCTALVNDPALLAFAQNTWAEEDKAHDIVEKVHK